MSSPSHCHSLHSVRLCFNVAPCVKTMKWWWVGDSVCGGIVSCSGQTIQLFFFFLHRDTSRTHVQLWKGINGFLLGCDSYESYGRQQKYCVSTMSALLHVNDQRSSLHSDITSLQKKLNHSQFFLCTTRCHFGGLWSHSLLHIWLKRRGWGCVFLNVFYIHSYGVVPFLKTVQTFTNPN